jgi:hypothetical protein
MFCLHFYIKIGDTLCKVGFYKGIVPTWRSKVMPLHHLWIAFLFIHSVPTTLQCLHQLFFFKVCFITSSCYSLCWLSTLVSLLQVLLLSHSTKVFFTFHLFIWIFWITIFERFREGVELFSWSRNLKLVTFIWLCWNCYLDIATIHVGCRHSQVYKKSSLPKM